MSLLPFRLRVTADGVGTLGEVRVRAELVNRAELAADDPAPPAPWAWFRADDLSGTFDEATVWPDRVGSRDIDNGMDGSHTLDPAYIGSQPGLLVAEEVAHFWDGLPAGTGYDEKTFAIVSKVPPDSGSGSYFTFGQNQLYWRHNYIAVNWTGAVVVEEFEQMETGAYAGPALIICRASRSGEWMDIRINEELMVTGNITPPATDDTDNIRLSGTEGAAEMLLYDRVLTEAEMSALWAYVQDRYGL